MFSDFSAVQYWLVTGTPDSSRIYPTALGLNVTEPSFVSNSFSQDIPVQYTTFLWKDFMYKNLFWRNLKSNVSDEYKLAPCEENPIFADFHPIERALYESEDINTDFMSSRFIDVFYTNQSPSLYDLLLRKIAFYKQRIQQIERSYNQVFREDELEKIREKLEILEECKKSQKRRKSLVPGKDFDLGRAIAQYGTKLAYLLQFIFSTWDEQARSLIFSQSNQLLRNIDSILSLYGIQTAVLYGNVNIRRKAIRDFKEGNKRVMLLNLQGQESGTNLHSASHIILVDPITKHNIDNQLQAIGRAHRLGRNGEPVKIVRFIINDTYEKEQGG
eukprot:TRINITY_DN6063_c0_g1_i1.p1 TRINITY_DN6063_c0_g1~~TRINITY_DN6063_c0_g1_i1.p1  ORF type:complete len:330 (-),score=58.42 TRINITY_DN6063_c0_g1_i1:221-1210(-)